MGLPTISSRPRQGLLEHPALWDGQAIEPGDERAGPNRTVDQLASFSAAIVNVRWATTAVSLVLASSSILRPDWLAIVATVAVLSNTIYRSIHPLVYTGSPSDQVLLLLEVALFWAAVAATAFWQSPLIIAAASILVVAGFAGGFRLALRIGAVMTISLTIVGFAVSEWSPADMAEAIQWSALLRLTGVIAGYGRRISGEATRRHSATLDRVSQLTDANTLLFNLHRLAQTLPASLDQTEVLDSSLIKLRGLLDFDRAVFLLFEETDRTWVVAQQQAMGIRGTIDPVTLPESAKRAISTWQAIYEGDLSSDRPGLHPGSRSGLFAPLTARDRLIGLVVVESHKPGQYGENDRRTLQGFIEPMALAIDNARWFGRLRRASVDEERSRIARELHDRIGQSLACLGFDADRLLRYHEAGNQIGSELQTLREGVRAVTAEVRDALYDLRADVAEDKDFQQTIGEFATRLAERSNLQIDVDSVAETRLPLLQEREMWRIAQEALINVERHAEADQVTVRWRCDRHKAALDVADDGRGMAENDAGRIDSFGIVGMRERANSIGAALEIISKPGEGTTVRCYLNQT
ncbi:MAG: GAF domain-containing sensor histidine kinase [Acidimicrobiales bacterium]